MNSANHMPNIIYHWLKKQGVNLDRQTLEASLSNHPYYPSVFSVSDTLSDRLKITNYAIDISNAGREMAAQIPTPFMGLLKKDRQFVIVNRIDDQNVEYFDLVKNHKVKRFQFEEIWSGISLVAFPDEKSGLAATLELKAQRVINFLLAGAIGVLLLFLLSYTVQTSGVLNMLLLLGIKLAGLVVTISLLRNDYQRDSKLINSICKLGNSDCEDVIKSQNSKLLGGALSWAELGFGYFSGGILLILLNVANYESSLLLFALNVFAVLFSFYSVAFQLFVAKKACAVCLSTIALFWIEFFLIYDFFQLSSSFSFYLLSKSLIIFALPFVAWQFIKFFYKRDMENSKYKQELYAMKYISEIHDVVKKKLPDTTQSDSPGIVVQNNGDEHVITVITNPLCGPCTKTHYDLQAILAKDLPDTRIEVVFGISPQDKSSTAYFVSRFLLGVYLKHGRQQFINGIRQWYKLKTKTFEALEKALPLAIDNETADILLEKHVNWCDKYGINQTPTLIHNNYQAHAIFDLNDLRLFMMNNETESIITAPAY